MNAREGLTECYRGYKLCQCHVGTYLLLAEDWSVTHDSFRRLTAFISREGRQMTHRTDCAGTELSERLAGFRHCQKVALQYLCTEKNTFSTAESRHRLAVYLQRVSPISKDADTEDEDYEELGLYDEMQDYKALTLLVELWQTTNFSEFVWEADRIREQFGTLLEIGDSPYHREPESPVNMEPDNPVNTGPENPDLYIRNCPDNVIPEQTTGDGEGHVYQSISRLLHRSELFQHRLRLASVVHAASNHTTYVKQYCKMFENTPFNEVVGYFRRHVQGKSVCPCWDIPEDKERVIRLHVRHLIREVARPDRYSSHVQLKFLCDALGRPIIEHYETPRHTLYGSHRELQPRVGDQKGAAQPGSRDQKGTAQPLQIMWINYEREPDGILNHVVPLISFRGHHIWKWPSAARKVCLDRTIAPVQLGIQQAAVRLSTWSNISDTVADAHSNLSSGNTDSQYAGYVKAEKFLLYSVWSKLPKYVFKAHAPVVFRSLRQNVFDLDEDEWTQSVCGSVTEHAGGTVWFHPRWRPFFSTEDGRFTIYSISDQDVHSVMAVLPRYYRFMVQHAGKCLLPNFYGLYSYTQKSVISPCKLHLLVTDTSSLESTVHETYLVKPTVMNGGSNHVEGVDTAGDFYTTYTGGLLLETDTHQMLTDMVQEHVTFLESQNLTGYGMLIGIQRPEQTCRQKPSVSTDTEREDDGDLQRNNNESSAIDDLHTESTERIVGESGLRCPAGTWFPAASASGQKLLFSLRIVGFLMEQNRTATSRHWLKSLLNSKEKPVPSQHYAQLFRKHVFEEVLKHPETKHIQCRTKWRK